MLDRLQILNNIEVNVETCALCDLCLTPGKHVMHRGSPYAKIACIGEAPGFHEAEQGVPFVGRSGKREIKSISSTSCESSS